MRRIVKIKMGWQFKGLRYVKNMELCQKKQHDASGVSKQHKVIGNIYENPELLQDAV